MITPNEIVSIYNQRSNDSGHMQQVMREVLDLYQGDIAVPLPEFQSDERPGIANIARAGIDQKAQRIASVFPEMSCSPTRPNKTEIRKAGERTRALYGMHEWNKTPRKLRRVARHLVAYASAPIVVRASFESQLPTFDARSPLGCYAAPTGDPDLMVPTDCIFATRRSMGWLKAKFPEQWGKLWSKEDTQDTPIDLLEYVDSEVVWLLAAKRGTDGRSVWDHEYAIAQNAIHTVTAVEPLSMYPNRAGIVPVVIPGEITLGPQKSTYTQIIGMYQAAAALDALSLVAQRKGVLQEEWLIANPGEEPELVQAANPVTGTPGIVKGASLTNRSVDPQFGSRIAVGDRERAMRLTAGLPAELGGEAATNVRTGRRADQLLSAVLDFPVQEAHKLIEESLEHVNEVFIRMDHGYFKTLPKVFAVNFAGEKGDLAYTPEDLWPKADGSLATRSKVSYFAAGLDAGDRIVALGQRLGMGTISAETVMRHDPLVDDVEGERSKTTAESIERAILTQIQTLAADPQSPLSTEDYTLLLKRVRAGDAIDEAWAAVQEAIQQRQAEAAAQAEQAQALPGAPQAMPGAGPEAQVNPQIQGPPEDLSNLNSLLMASRGPALTSPQG